MATFLSDDPKARLTADSSGVFTHTNEARKVFLITKGYHAQGYGDKVNTVTEVLDVAVQSKLFRYYKAQSHRIGGFVWVSGTTGKIKQKDGTAITRGLQTGIGQTYLLVGLEF